MKRLSENPAAAGTYQEKGEKMITINLDNTTAAQLAEFCKRAMPERVEAFAADEAEAYNMMKALDGLKEALADQGFDPR
jgi:hypothetical protein